MLPCSPCIKHAPATQALVPDLMGAPSPSPRQTPHHFSIAVDHSIHHHRLRTTTILRPATAIPHTNTHISRNDGLARGSIQPPGVRGGLQRGGFTAARPRPRTAAQPQIRAPPHRIISKLAARDDGRPQQPQLPHQDRPRNDHARLPLQGRHHRRHRFPSNGW